MAISVLMSVYFKESPGNLLASLLSLSEQTFRADEVVLVEDGAISDRLQSVIELYRNDLNIVSIRLPENAGLGMALNEGLKYCRHELVARMDTDDISLPSRFEKQVAFMQANPEIAASSAILEEWDEEMRICSGRRSLPLEPAAVARFALRRSPLSHPLAIFRKSIVLAVGGYPPLRKAQDHALWSLLLTKGYSLANLPEVLLKMRTGSGLLGRRGFSYFQQELELLRFQKSIGFLSERDFYMNILIKGALRFSPNIMKRAAYKFFR